MPRRAPIRTIAQLSQHLRKHRVRRHRAFVKSMSRPAVVQLAVASAQNYLDAIEVAPKRDRAHLFRMTPSFDAHVEKADEALMPDRAQLARTSNARLSRQATYRIGPLTCQGLQLPPGFEPVRLPLTINGFIEKLIRETKRKSPQAWHLWLDLKTALQEIGTLLDHSLDVGKSRRETYSFIIESRTERITFGEFQKIWTEVRRSQKVLR